MEDDDVTFISSYLVIIYGVELGNSINAVKYAYWTSF